MSEPTNNNLPIKTLTNKRYCGQCGSPVIDDDGSLLVGSSLRDHECFADSESNLEIIGQIIYKSKPEQQSQKLMTQTRPVVESNDFNSSSPNLISLNGPKAPLHSNTNQVVNLVSIAPRNGASTPLLGSTNRVVNLIPVDPRRFAGSFNRANSVLVPASTAVSHNNGQQSAVIVSSSLPQRGNEILCNQNNANQLLSLTPSNQTRLADTFGNFTTAPNMPNNAESSNADYRASQITYSPSFLGAGDNCSANEFITQNGTIEPVLEGKKTLKWTDSMTKLLLETYKPLHEQLTNGQYFYKKSVHKRVSEEMQKYGYDISPESIQTKLRLLESAYKKRVDNKGSKQSGASRLKLQFEDGLEDIFGKKHSIHPTHLIGPTWEYSSKSAPENENSLDECLAEIEGMADNEDRGSKNESEEPNTTSKCKKRKKYQFNLTESENQIKEKYHAQNLERKDEYISLKKKELALKEESKKKELAIKEKGIEDLLKLKKMNLLLKAQKYKAEYPNATFYLPE